MAETEKKDSDEGTNRNRKKEADTPLRHVEHLRVCGHSLEEGGGRGGAGGKCQRMSQ